MKKVLFAIMTALTIVSLSGCLMPPGRVGYQPSYQGYYSVPEPQYYRMPNGVVFERQRYFDQHQGWVHTPIPYGGVKHFGGRELRRDQQQQVWPQPYQGHRFDGRQSPQHKGREASPQRQSPPSNSNRYMAPGSIIPWKGNQ